MKLAVIQMSDLHITSGTDYIVEKSRNLARATASILNECSKVAVVVTGDIVDKGNVANYQFAKKMFQDFKNEIEKERKFDSWEYVFVPGNHDLDFGMDVPFRDFVLKDVLDNGAFKRNEYESEALKPQYEFWKFYAELSGDEHLNRISYEKQIKINNNSSLIFHCYNTALLSTINEQPQSLIVPEANFITYNDDNGRNDIVISVFHHKTGWLATRGTKNNNVFVKPNEQSSSLLEYSAMARNRLLKTNDFVKPKDQREFIRFGLARNRTVKNVFVKPNEQSSSLLEYSAMARNRTVKNYC